MLLLCTTRIFSERHRSVSEQQFQFGCGHAALGESARNVADRVAKSIASVTGRENSRSSSVVFAWLKGLLPNHDDAPGLNARFTPDGNWIVLRMSLQAERHVHVARVDRAQDFTAATKTEAAFIRPSTGRRLVLIGDSAIGNVEPTVTDGSISRAWLSIALLAPVV